MPTITKECVYIIMYPRYKEGSTTPARFDMDYYMNVHCPEAEELWKGMGMKKIEVHQLPEGKYSVVTTVTWWDYESFDKARKADISQPLFAKEEVAHYSDVYPEQHVSYRVV